MDILYYWFVLHEYWNISTLEMLKLIVLFYFLTKLSIHLYFKNKSDEGLFKLQREFLNTLLPFTAFLILLCYYLTEKICETIFFIKLSKSYQWIVYQLNKER